MGQNKVAVSILFLLMGCWQQPQLWETLSYPDITDPPFLPHLSAAEPHKEPVLRGSSLWAGVWREGGREGTNSFSSLLPKLPCHKATSKCRWYFLSHQLLLPHKGA